MVKCRRVYLDGACYHLITRGNRKKDVFWEKGDFQKYLDLLMRYKMKYRFRMYAYCLMKNHVHLIIEPCSAKDISKIMHGINRAYTYWFNEKYDQVGHLWQGRFRSWVIQKDRYLLECIRYIEFNPIRAELVEELAQYPWCSYRFHFLGENDPLVEKPELI